MKKILFIILTLSTLSILNAQNIPNAWINEFHYDNQGADVNEFVEIIVENPTIYNLDSLILYLYNGGDSTVYAQKPLSFFAKGDSIEDFHIFYYLFPTTTIQNGSPDGFGLSYCKQIIAQQFISYEGTFQAKNGPAVGLNSSDIEVSETSTTSNDYSLQLNGEGNKYIDFLWSSPDSSTMGKFNRMQNMTTEYITSVLQENIEPLTIFPNPSSTYLTISFNSDEIKNIKIISLSGKIILEQTQIDKNIEVNNLPTGMYFVQISYLKTNKVFTKKVIIH